MAPISAIPASSTPCFHSKQHRQFMELPFRISLALLVLLDMVGVSLVVPLLHSHYYPSAGIASANQREWLSSIYFAAQIVGGLLVGALMDAHVVSRKSILLISFGGSALAYAMILQGSWWAMVVSRVLVGLIKHTMTATSAIMAQTTRKEERASQVGRLNASLTAAWIVGPSMGAFLVSNVGTYAPVYLSCSLFLVNIGLVLFCWPSEENENPNEEPKLHPREKQGTMMTRMLSNFQACFFGSDDSYLSSVISAMLLFKWTRRTTSYKNIATYYEARYNTEPYQRGYIQSYQSALMLVVQSMLVRPILEWVGGEVAAACGAALLLAVVLFLEVQATLWQYLVVLCPLHFLALAMLGVTLKSIVSKAAPTDSLGSVFATLNVLENVAQVTVPFYRTMLFAYTQPAMTAQVGGSNTTTLDDYSAMTNGDPDPKQWLVSSGIHWMVALVAFSHLLKASPCSKRRIVPSGNQACSEKLKAK